MEIKDVARAIALCRQYQEALSRCFNHLENLHTIGAEIRQIGYTAFPDLESITAYSHGNHFDLTLKDIDDPSFLESCLYREEIDDQGSSDTLFPKKKSPNSLDLLAKEFSFVCFYCKRTGTPELGPDGSLWTRDHVVPRCYGGTNASDNIVLSCKSCNCRKGTKTIAEFRLYMEKK